MLLIPSVPLLKKVVGDSEMVCKDKSHTEDDPSQLMLENLHKVHEVLESRLHFWQGARRELMNGKQPDELGLPVDGVACPQITAAQKSDLGFWMSDMLVSHGFKRWPENLDAVKVMCQNAFPQIRDVELAVRAEDIEYILESHLMLEQRWEHYVLQRTGAGNSGLEGDIGGVVGLSMCSRRNPENREDELDDLEGGRSI